MYFTFDANNTKGGTWSHLGQTAMLKCPYCNRFATLSNHTIAPDGMVTPSLVCPYEDCDFHDYVQLENWKQDNDVTS